MFRAYTGLSQLTRVVLSNAVTNVTSHISALRDKHKLISAHSSRQSPTLSSLLSLRPASSESKNSDKQTDVQECRREPDSTGNNTGSEAGARTDDASTTSTSDSSSNTAHSTDSTASASHDTSSQHAATVPEQLERLFAALKGATKTTKEELALPTGIVRSLVETALMVQRQFALRRMNRVDSNFSHDDFREGVKDAYWAVVQMWGDHNTDELHSMVSTKFIEAYKDTYDFFKQRGYEWNMEIECIDDAYLTDAAIVDSHYIARWDKQRAGAGADGSTKPFVSLSCNAEACDEYRKRSDATDLWLVAVARILCADKSLITNAETGQVLREQRDLRGHFWALARGPLPRELPSDDISAPWFVLSTVTLPTVPQV